ncbi:hypothetical protein DYB30_005055 [Aphanomyces astaci]|uniref:Uncharacterized protein n=1 Tax=Aphanomyces astaci TaxID=112090 RepID=A0A397DBW9_APHAT|nr:hypothetical protein DYB38_008583 [Aphanomyces astaci]RHY62523.1 hypothetical protein DYB30_005055 [Aphanomyces astaci]RHZ31685.1 hypothetical protein DYB26_011484 [Aphanomyces astaci]RHZ34410.1 hypothetical protein DYB31_012872 [Aphanomyces astaci]
MLGTFEPVMPYDFAVDEALVTAKYQRASKLVTSVFNKYHNGSHRAVDTVVVSALLQEEDALFGLQCLVEQGPAAICRERKESEVRTITSQTTINAVQGLLEVRRLLHENRELKVRIQTIAQDTDSTVNAQLAVAATLRTDAIAQGCNMLAVDKSIQSKWREDNPALDLHVKTPPAHKFRVSSEQLRVANRQLVMCLKVAETRAKKALDKVEITTAVLQEAIQNQRKPWRPIARLIVPFLTVVDIKRLAQVLFHPWLHMAFNVPQFWMWRACHDPDTHKYVCDLAEAVTSHLGGASAADEDSDEALHWSSIMLKASPTWSEAYALVVAKCGENGCLEHDKQILADVDRTFGRSSLRKQARKVPVRMIMQSLCLE